MFKKQKKEPNTSARAIRTRQRENAVARIFVGLTMAAALFFGIANQPQRTVADDEYRDAPVLNASTPGIFASVDTNAALTSGPVPGQTAAEITAGIRENVREKQPH